MTDEATELEISIHLMQKALCSFDVWCAANEKKAKSTHVHLNRCEGHPSTQGIPKYMKGQGAQKFMHSMMRIPLSERSASMKASASSFLS